MEENNNPPVTTSQFFERILNERHRLYETRFTEVEKSVAAAFAASDKATSAALAAAEKAVAAAFAAAEKAVLKAEQAQAELNIKNNEFRRQLDDQAATFMPRQEANAVQKSTDERITALQEGHAGLRESNSETGGRTEGSQTSWAFIFGAAVLLTAVFEMIKMFAKP